MPGLVVKLIPTGNLGHNQFNSYMLEQNQDILIFEINGRRQGLLASGVEELVRMVALTPLPGAPALFDGAMNLRGQIVPVADLRDPLHMPRRHPEVGDHLIIIRNGAGRLALRVDRAIDLVRLQPEQVSSAMSIAADMEQGPWLTKVGDELIPIHTLESLLPHLRLNSKDGEMTGRKDRPPESDKE